MPNIMNPVLPAQGAQRPLEPGKQIHDSGNKFSDHLKNRVQAKENRQSDKLGLRAQEQKKAKSSTQTADRQPSKELEDNQETALSSADLLAMLLQELQQLAQDKDSGPGQWQVEMPDLDQLNELALHAGMAEEELNSLLEQFTSGDDETSLPDFLQTLINHFQTFTSDQPVTTAETDLPMLETLLAKLGLTSDQINTIAAASVNQDGVLDLEQFQASLTATAIDPAQMTSIPLTDWETEQLQNLMARAGVNLGEQLKLLPEALQDQAPVFDLARLQGLLDKTITLAQDAQPTIQPPAFLADLAKILQQTDFARQDVGFSPAIQQSRSEAYQNLLDIFAQNQLRYSNNLRAEDEKLQADIQKWLTGLVSEATDQENLTDPKIETSLADNQLLDLGDEQNSTPLTSTTLGGSTSNTTGQTSHLEAQGNTVPRPTTHHIQQQQLFNQLSMAITRGLRSGEHHLILKLHPAELGEVKVDLSVHHEHVSVSFAMENSKVKETLESSMEEFRQNMEDKGFTMGQVNVEVGQQDDSNQWQRFELPSWPGEKLTASTMENLPESALYFLANSDNYHDDRGLSLFV